MAQLALDLDPAPCPGVHAGGEEVQAVAQAVADLRTRGLGRLQQVLGVGAVLRMDADAQARAHVQELAVDRHRAGDLVEDASRERGQRVGIGELGDQHEELVTAQAGEAAAPLQAARDALGHHLQQAVAGVLTEALVHPPEAVEVEQQHRGLALAGGGALHRLLQPLHEELAVGEAGEGIVVGQVVEPGLVLLLAADVAEHAHVVRGQAVGAAHRTQCQALGVDLAALAPVPHLADPRAARDQRVPHAGVEGGVVAAGFEHARIEPEHLGARMAGDALEGRVAVEDVAGEVGHHDAFVQALDDLAPDAQVGLAGVQAVLGVAAGPAPARLGQAARQRRGEAREIVLGHVVVCAERHQAASLLVGERGRDDHEGQVEAARLHLGERLLGAEPGQGVVAQHRGPRAGLERGAEFRGAIDAARRRHRVAGALELAHDQRGIGFVVLDDQQVDGLAHACPSIAGCGRKRTPALRSMRR